MRQPDSLPDNASDAVKPKHKPFEPLKFRDFRILWTGALLSFIGSWVQNVAQGWLVFELTRDEQKLAWVAFCGMIPVSIFGPFAGTVTDVLNRRAILIITQVIFAVNALFLAYTNWNGTIRYEQILVIALINGFASTVEMPTRQSLVSSVVPAEYLSSAVPLQAMTFNLARVVGPAVGGLLLAKYGPQSCYMVNGLSYVALIFAVFAIRADLKPRAREVQPIKDLLFEGMLYTFRDVKLKQLFLMEATVSIFGLAYIPLIPAFAKEQLGLDKIGLGTVYTSVGVGALTGLILLIQTSGRPHKALLVKFAMTSMGSALLALSFMRQPWMAYPLFSLLGLSTIVQFNTTNTLFQLIAPARLRGRVLAMHIWALSGSAPIALPLFGWLSKHYSVPVAMQFGGAVVAFGAILGWINGHRLHGVDSSASYADA